jgi:deferrochelatase/peroxidase EfeB
MTDDPVKIANAPVSDGQRRGRPISRRGFFGAVGGVAVGGALAGAGLEVTKSDAPPNVDVTLQRGVEPFYGVHQGGILTSPQRYTNLVAFDVITDKKRDVADLLRHWTTAASRLTQGRAAARLTDDPERIEPDSGEALGLGPARLTINFGFGPTLFTKDGDDRFGLVGRQPYELAELPSFPGDELIESKCGGDLTVHACSDDPQVAFHAVRQLARAANGIASIRWSQSGFNETAVTSGTPRNLLGFKDGTINPKKTSDLAQYVWVGYEGPAWMTGGTYLVMRRIRASLEDWDNTPVGAQEQIIGRHKRSGAPLGQSSEFDALDLRAKNSRGDFTVPLDAHVRLASPEENWGATMLRRSYAYDDGINEPIDHESSNQVSPTLDAGLLFACYQRNPLIAFVAIFKKLATNDALRQFTMHTGSLIVAIPPAAVGPSEWVGQRLFETQRR